MREQHWSLLLRNLPDHPSIKRGAAKAGSSRAKGKENQATADNSEGFVLKAQRPSLTRVPEPPNALAAWLAAGCEDPSEGILLRQTQEHPDTEGKPSNVHVDG